MVQQFKSHLLSLFLKIVLNFTFLTCRWIVLDEQNILKGDKPKLVCCWHSRSLFVARFFKYKKIKSWGISSTHKDSQILARVLLSWGINLIRGSSSRGWVGVLKKMIVLFKDSSTIITVTSDGPKGPRKIPKMGSVDAAYKHGANIIAASGISSRFWTLPSWDQTKIPKPFSTIYICFSSHHKEKKPSEKSITNLINNNQNRLAVYIKNIKK